MSKSKKQKVPATDPKNKAVRQITYREAYEKGISLMVINATIYAKVLKRMELAGDLTPERANKIEMVLNLTRAYLKEYFLVGDQTIETIVASLPPDEVEKETTRAYEAAMKSTGGRVARPQKKQPGKIIMD